MKFLSQLHAKFGDFWWWSLCLFLAMRVGDVVNAVVGLWLVPKYVGQEQLGAVLPLTQASTVFGLPISILMMTFIKFLNQYHTEGESGKVKALIRSFWGLSLVAISIGTTAAVLLLPHFFERIRVVSGSLGILIIVSAILGTTAPVFTNGLQALKKFRAITIMNLFGAPIRLVVMLVAMPFRALSGYMLGQASVPAMQIVWSWFSLRKEIDRSIKPVPFWKEDGRKMVRYTLGVALWMGVSTIAGAIQSMIIRQRLPEVESAAYYMISRFSELATYAGITISVVMFPLAAEANVNGRDNLGVLFRSTLAALLFGVVCIIGLWIGAPLIFKVVPDGNVYQVYSSDLVLLAFGMLLSVLVSNFYSYETANGRFSFLWCSVPIWIVYAVVLVCFTGCDFFVGRLPASAIEWMRSFNLASLRNIIWWMIIELTAMCCCAGAQILWREKIRKGGLSLCVLR